MSLVYSLTPTRRRELLAVLLLAALILAFFWKLAFTNLVIARGDIFLYFDPYREFAAQALRAGRLPLWNPTLFMGAPFLANSQAGVFYPLNSVLLWIDTPRAINWTLVLHVIIAATGVYTYTRSRLRLSIAAAFLAGSAFGLGGYLGTQVEHVNQVQGLAWLGWLFLAYDAVITGSRAILTGGLLAMLISFQLLAGHTQTVFISLVGLGVYALWQMLEAWRAARRFHVSLLARYILPLAVAALFASALSAVQLLPTLELTRASARSGGLPANLAVSFSLDPRLIGRALLPDYAGALPAGGEFTAFFSVTALLLLTLGLLNGWARTSPLAANRKTLGRAISLVALLGVFLALGGFNPIYYLLLKVPGFDLFRAPARWLVLFVFAGSVLAGLGLDGVRGSIARRWLIAPLLFIAALLITTALSAGLTPAGASGPLPTPDAASLVLWLAAGILSAIFVLRFTRRPSLLMLLAVLELFLATRALPYNSRATAPDALTNLRPATAYLMAQAADQRPPDRFLSLSQLRFDPGDTAELASIYHDQLSVAAYYDLIVATKAKEVLAPNLPLYFGVPAVDGYDGGVLPLRHYLTFQQLFLNAAQIQTDGRLREQLTAVPAARWLNVMNARYVLTDKVGDQWYDGILYDLQFTTPLAPGASVSTDQVPPFKANALGVVYTAPAGHTLAHVTLTFADGTSQVLPLIDQPVATHAGLAATRLPWTTAHSVNAVTITATAPITLHGLALIDQASATFQSFVIAPAGRFRVAYSGDVKIYENVDVLPRAFCVSAAHVAADDAAAVAYLQRPDFDPAREVVLMGGPGEQGSGIADQAAPLPRAACRVSAYEPERVTVETAVEHDSYLVLTDAYYPGWSATLDGLAVPIERADVLFRAVQIPAGAHRVEFRYAPPALAIGAAVSIGAWAVWLGGLLVAGVRAAVNARRRVL